MWFREDRGALETPPNSENSREDRRTLQKTPRELKNLSKTANFSISTIEKDHSSALRCDPKRSENGGLRYHHT
jgi:hypothetical protein